MATGSADEHEQRSGVEFIMVRNYSKELPNINSYDSGYEHSLEHFIETRRLVAEADEVTQTAIPSARDQKLKLARKAS